MEKKFIEFIYSKVTVGNSICIVFKFLNQTFRGARFYRGTCRFCSENGYVLMSGNYPTWNKSTKTLFVLGVHSIQTDMVVISEEHFEGVIYALNSYNKEMNKIYETEKIKENIIEEKPIDYFSLHKETWLRITYATPPYCDDIKAIIVKQICEREKITTPLNHCFLCEYVKRMYLRVACDKCYLQSCDYFPGSTTLHGKWVQSLVNNNWTTASQLAWKIANIVDSKI